MFLKSRTKGIMALFAAAMLFMACGDDDNVTPETDQGLTPDTTISDTGTELKGSALLTLNDKCGTAGLEGATVSYTNGTDVTSDTNGEANITDLTPGDYEFTVTKTGYLPVKINVTVTADQEVTGSADVECQSLVVAEAARTFLTAAKDATPITKSSAVFDLFNDGDDTNDPIIVSVRATADYEVAHVPTAINIPWKTVADDASLALLGTPGDKDLVDYCYTGHTGGIASVILNLLGYPTKNLKYGFASWTSDETKRGPMAVNPDQSNDFIIETTENTTTETHEVPFLEYANVETAEQAVKEAAKGYLNADGMAPAIKAQALFDNLNDGDTTNDPFIISVRKADHYKLGHIPGAINIPWTEIALAENLAKIPTDKQIVVYCYTGHTGAIATTVLGVLGYHKVTNLKFGYLGWAKEGDASLGTANFDANTDVNDFQTVAGTDPGTFTTN